MRIKRPEQYYKVKYATGISQEVYAVQFIAKCLTLESAITACKEAVQINGWDSGVVIMDLLANGKGELLDRIEINVDDVRSELEEME